MKVEPAKCIKSRRSSWLRNIKLNLKVQTKESDHYKKGELSKHGYTNIKDTPGVRKRHKALNSAVKESGSPKHSEKKLETN